jgi:magnesium transporter
MDGSAAPADQAGIEQALDDDKLLWLDVLWTSPDDVAMLTDIFKLHPLAAADLTEFGQRPKIEDFGNLVYMVSYGIKGDGNDLTEVHCFFAEKFLVTVRRDGCHSLEKMRDRIGSPNGLLPGPNENRPTRLILLHNIMDSLIDSFFPSLAAFDDRIDELQEMIFSKPSNEQLAELFTMQRWLVSVRKLISPARDAMASLVGGMVTLPGMSADSDPYLRDLYDHLIRISDLIDSYRDLLTNAMDAYLSMVSNNLNEVMKQLAIIATIFLPLSFLTGFFGQNFAWLVGDLGGLPVFLIVGIGTELVAVLGLYWLFRRRGWIGAARPSRLAAAARGTGDAVHDATKVSAHEVPTWLTDITRDGRWRPKPAPGQAGEGQRARSRQRHQGGQLVAPGVHERVGDQQQADDGDDHHEAGPGQLPAGRADSAAERE